MKKRIENPQKNPPIRLFWARITENPESIFLQIMQIRLPLHSYFRKEYGKP
jgi:hypothetical protein